MSVAVKILVVDDDQMMLDFAVSAFVSLGYSAVPAQTVATALKLVEQDEQIGAMMIDLRLGRGPTGVELARAALAIRPEVKIILTSGSHSSLQDAELELPEIVAVLPKPYRRRDLVA